MSRPPCNEELFEWMKNDYNFPILQNALGIDPGLVNIIDEVSLTRYVICCHCHFIIVVMI